MTTHETPLHLGWREAYGGGHGYVTDERFDDLWMSVLGPTCCSLLRLSFRMMRDAAWPIEGVDSTYGYMAEALGVTPSTLHRSLGRLAVIGHHADTIEGGWMLAISYNLPNRVRGERASMALQAVAPWAVQQV